MPLRFAWEKPAPHSTPCFASPRVELAVMQFASPLALCAFGSQPGETCTLSDIARFLSKSGNLWLRPPHRLLALMYVGPGRHFYQVLLTANGTQSAFLNT